MRLIGYLKILICNFGKVTFTVISHKMGRAVREEYLKVKYMAFPMIILIKRLNENP